MKSKRRIIVGVFAALIIAYGFAVIHNFQRRTELERTIAALQTLPHDRVEAAAQAFARDRKGKVSVGTVSLREMVAGGYLRAGEIRGLEDKDVVVSLDADETAPSAIWIRVRASNGFDIVLMADGSVEEIPRR